MHKLQKTEPLNEHCLLLVNLVVASRPVVLNGLVLPVINPLAAAQQLQIGVQQPLWALVVPAYALLVELHLPTVKLHAGKA